MCACPATDEFFRCRIDQMIDLRLPLAVLASRMTWQAIEDSISRLFMRKVRHGVAMPDVDRFGKAPAVVGRTSNAGRPRVPLRVMVALLYLKHAFNETDKCVVARWADTPHGQFFSGGTSASRLFAHKRSRSHGHLRTCLKNTFHTRSILKPDEWRNFMNLLIGEKKPPRLKDEGGLESLFAVTHKGTRSGRKSGGSIADAPESILLRSVRNAIRLRKLFLIKVPVLMQVAVKAANAG